ncbi:MAG: dihydrofolate reductase [Flavobacteriaceae bacterium]|nr:dihydrofolate reductase [Flavobacteriaceae bacterium]
MQFTIIAAVGKNGALGKDNKLLWHLPDDLKRFKKLTMDQTIIMGRKTFESLPFVLPHREHIVLSRSLKTEDPKVYVAHTVEDVLEVAQNVGKVNFVIGGGEVYKLFLPFSDRIELTKVDASPAADTFFPEIDSTDWQVVNYQKHAADEKHAHGFSFITYERK